jgi:hypothetical protein
VLIYDLKLLLGWCSESFSKLFSISNVAKDT